MTTHRLRSAGFSLVELMIAMVIGFVVVGAVFSAYLNAGSSGRSGRALSQMTEDASLAFNVLRSGLNMVGYSAPTDVKDGKFVKAYNGLGLFGCDTAFTDTSKSIDQLTCDAKGTSDTIAVVYQADEHNSVVSGADPLDCLGNAIKAIPGPAPYLNYSRYYVQNNQLFCLGPGNDKAQALVDNVADLQFMYGVSNPTPGKPETYRVIRYSAAADMGLPNAVDWANTMSIRVCLVVRSADAVLSEAMGYQGCSGAVPATPGDLHMYRMFTSTVVLQNRVGAVQ